MNKDIIIERQANENLKLVNDNKDLQQRINKAIEYINNTDLSVLDKWKLQDILRGEDNE